ncbi:hypothetical protein QUV83_01935 [Cellulomonas cellasea]|uniref:hypothetical protein n=1 Tax=Cellulomonas cellasea TaxID=43670 RepID=UPI0025A4466E|nr:hypothetical protein [Cellulomonas cellasea]MDM8083526.1 hypothetical protein [Cellulomonas cellasea]
MTNPGFTAQVALVALQRAAAWDALADVLDEPTPELVERLRSGELVETWRTGVAWLGADATTVGSPLLSLDVFVRGAARRTAEDDLAMLMAEHPQLVGPDLPAVRRLHDVAELCRDESRAWAEGDLETGKALRAGQRVFLDEHLVDVLPEVGRRLVQDSRRELWRALGRLLLAFLSAESGRDYQRSVLGETGRRRVDPAG